MPIATDAFADVRLTVTDIDRSRTFNEDVFGWPVAFGGVIDHVGFAVAARAHLDAAAALLDGRGVGHQGVKDIGVGDILGLRDPDGVASEQFAPKA